MAQVSKHWNGRRSPGARRGAGLWPLLAFAAVALTVGAMILLLGRGPELARGAEAADRVVAARAEAGPTEAAPELAAPEVAATSSRVEVATEAGAATVVVVDGEEGCVIEGLVRLPGTFPADAKVELRASRAEGEGEPALESAADDRSFRFELEPGTWTLTAVARAADRVAWGQCEPLELVQGAHQRAVEIATDEYYVDVSVTDGADRPLPGLIFETTWTRPRTVAPQTIRMGGPNELSAPILISGLEALGSIGYGSPAMPTESEELDKPAAPTSVSFSVAPGRFEISSGQSIEASGESMQQLIEALVEAEGTIIELDGISINPERGSDDSGTGTFITDANGRFRVPVLGPAKVRVSGPNDQPEGVVRWRTVRESVEVTSLQPVAVLELKLRQAGRVEGRVARADGILGGIDLFLRHLGSPRTLNEKTDTDGSFEYANLEPGQYLLYARHGGDSGQDFSFYRELDLSEGGVVWVDDVLTLSSSVMGVVQDSNGAPVAGVRVTATGANNESLSRRATTDEFGAFTITGMYACEYDLSVQGRTLPFPAQVTVPPRGAQVGVDTVIVEEPL